MMTVVEDFEADVSVEEGAGSDVSKTGVYRTNEQQNKIEFKKNSGLAYVAVKYRLESRAY